MGNSNPKIMYEIKGDDDRIIFEAEKANRMRKSQKQISSNKISPSYSSKTKKKKSKSSKKKY